MGHVLRQREQLGLWACFPGKDTVPASWGSREGSLEEVAVVETEGERHSRKQAHQQEMEGMSASGKAPGLAGCEVWSEPRLRGGWDSGQGGTSVSGEESLNLIL